MNLEDYIKKFYKKNAGKEHVNEVLRFAFEIFDEIVSISEYKALKKYKKCLEIASLLHDIGMNIEDGAHHARVASEFVLEEGINGVNADELKIISCLIRYHRGKKPKKKHEIYGSFERDMRKIIKKLSAILQVADLLDFGHFSYVENIEISIENEKFIIKTNPNISRLAGFEEFRLKKVELFERAFGFVVEII